MEVKARIAELTAKKLELEIEEIQRPFFKKASFLSLAVPILAALITGVIGYLGNIEIQKLNEEKARLTATTRQLVADQRVLSSHYMASIQDYLTYLRSISDYKEDPNRLFTESAVMDAREKLDAWLSSQKRSILFSRNYADKYQELLGADETQETVARIDELLVLVDKMQAELDDAVEEVLRELRKR